MTILLTGGLGKTSALIAKRLHAASIPFVIASRSGSAPAPYKAVAFDWSRPETFENPFTADAHIDRVYLVIPEVSLAAHAPEFIELARSKGVKRFVLLSASQNEAGGRLLGGVHKYLAESGVDYAVLRPTWFHQNFGIFLRNGIRDYDQTLSAMEDGRIPFVSADEIVQVAVEALTAETSLNKDILIFGPKLLTQDEVAELFTKILGRKITHARYTVEELRQLCLSLSFSEELAETYSSMENAVARGVEEELFNSDKNKFVGKITLESYIRDNRELWLKK